MSDWQALREALTQPKPPRGAKTATELAEEMGVSVKKLVNEARKMTDEYESGVFTVDGHRQRVYWPKVKQ